MNKLYIKFQLTVISFFVFAGLFEFAAAQGSAQVTNPLDAENVGQFLLDIVDVITTLAVPVIAIMIIYAGFLFVTAGGDESQIEDAKSTALYVAIGAAIILGADLIIAVLENTTESIGTGGLG
jgi:hypothetical protein